MNDQDAGDCVFCKIVRGELPCARVFEDEQCLAFLDIAPVCPGHTLLIPKRHYTSALEAPAEALAALAQRLPVVAGAVVKATRADGFSLMQLNGRSAGQVVPHLHFHVIPRSDGDGVSFGLRQGNAYQEGQIARLAAAIAAAVESRGD